MLCVSLSVIRCVDTQVRKHCVLEQHGPHVTAVDALDTELEDCSTREALAHASELGSTLPLMH